MVAETNKIDDIQPLYQQKVTARCIFSTSGIIKDEEEYRLLVNDTRLSYNTVCSLKWKEVDIEAI